MINPPLAKQRCELYRKPITFATKSYLYFEQDIHRARLAISKSRIETLNLIQISRLPTPADVAQNCILSVSSDFVAGRDDFRTVVSSAIPKGFRLKAQCCEARATPATLGQSRQRSTTPTGLRLNPKHSVHPIRSGVCATTPVTPLENSSRLETSPKYACAFSRILPH